MTEPRSIALFGGTFDPPHAGHLWLAENARSALGIDQVRFLPCRISPHKTDTRPTPGPLRGEMLRVATAGRPWAVVDERELGRAGPSYSVDTAEELASEFPRSRLFWILGGDQWQALPLWKNSRRLADCVEFIVLPREGHVPEPREGHRLHVLQGRHPASATAIRQALGQGADFPAEWLPPGLAGWIESHGLYRA